MPQIISITNKDITIVDDDNQQIIIQRKFICKDLIYNNHTFIAVTKLEQGGEQSDRSYYTAICEQDGYAYRIEYFNKKSPTIYDKPDNIVKIGYQD